MIVRYEKHVTLESILATSDKIKEMAERQQTTTTTTTRILGEQQLPETTTSTTTPQSTDNQSETKK